MTQKLILLFFILVLTVCTETTPTKDEKIIIDNTKNEHKLSTSEHFDRLIKDPIVQPTININKPQIEVQQDFVPPYKQQETTNHDKTKKIIKQQKITQKIDSNEQQRKQQPIKKQPITQQQPKKQQKNYPNLWDEISDNRSLFNYKHKDLYWHLKWFIENPDYLTRVSKRATPYLKLVLDEVKKNKMPYEIALLPIVESAYYPFAYSHGTASGIWQFIPSTAKLYGLQQNFWIDERRDILKSTKAALKYLNNLYTLFDDWLLVIAAYNSGPGRVQKAIAKNKKLGKKTNFWHLDLPVETSGYVPRLLTVAELIKNPTAYGQKITKIENKSVISWVSLNAQLDLSLVSEWTGLSIDEIYELNPALNRWATPDDLYNLILPINKIAQFNQKLKNFPKNQRIKWIRHKIKSGESINSIASLYHIKSKTLQEINQIKNNIIIADHYLIVPIANKDKSYYGLSQDELKRKRLSSGAKKIIHTVKKGDSLWGIARRYNTNVKSIVKWNKLKSKTLINVHDKLVIYQRKKLALKQLIARTKSQVNIRKTITYTIKSGDNLSKIANKFKVSIQDLVKWNHLDSNKLLKIGQKLKLFIDIINSK